MKVKFQTKNDSTKEKEEEFLALSKTERFFRFLELSAYFLSLPSKKKEEKKGNFIIEIPAKIKKSS
jgi:hypothetical protein